MKLHYYYYSYKYITIEEAVHGGRLYWFAYVNTTDFEDPIIVENYKTLRLLSKDSHLHIKSDFAEVIYIHGLFKSPDLEQPGNGNTVIFEMINN